MKTRPKCKHGITVGANCGKCLDAKKRTAGYQDAIIDLRNEAQRLRDWAMSNDTGSDQMGGRALGEAGALLLAAEWLEHVAGKRVESNAEEVDRLRRAMRQIANCRNPNPCATCMSIAQSNVDRPAKATEVDK